MTDDELQNEFSKVAFGYFRDNANEENGLVPDTSRLGSPASIACVGFGLSSYPIGVERGWMTREAAIRRILVTLRFFKESPQNDTRVATGFKGFYYHFLDMKTGLRTWDCEVSLIDTALLLAGMLTVASYFDRAAADELEIRGLVKFLYERVDWQWAQNGGPTLSQGWTPENGFMHRGWEGYNEATMLYLLGVASPTYPLSEGGYQAWTLTYQWEHIYGHDVLYAGPLFIHQFSHAWIDFRDIQDPFMREKNFDYFRNSRHATYIQRIYAEHNPYSFVGYGSDVWGLSASDGPGGSLLNIEGHDRRCFAYAARGLPYGPDDGTLSPSAVVASLPFAPEIVMPSIRAVMNLFPSVIKNYQLPSAFNPSATNAMGLPWVSDGLYGLDQGIVLLMIENHRSGLIWRLMRDCSLVRDGLRRADFTGGWLEKEA